MHVPGICGHVLDLVVTVSVAFELPCSLLQCLIWHMHILHDPTVH